MLMEWWYFEAHLKDRIDPQNTFGAALIFFKDGGSFLIIADIKNQKKYSTIARNPFEILSSDRLALKSGDNYYMETDLFKYKLSYHYKNFGLDFFLKALKNPMILSNGSKSSWGSIYYRVQPRVDVSGELTLEDKKYDVNGSGWMEHAYSATLISEAICGWRWWAVHLDNNVEIMFNELAFVDEQESDLKQDPLFIFDKNSSGFNFEKISRDQYILKESNYWKDPQTNITYPISWSLEVPARNVNLEINSVLKDQVIEGTSTYEGVCRATGIYGGEAIEGWVQFDAVSRREHCLYNTEY